jgi:hypothetical protein
MSLLSSDVADEQPEENPSIVATVISLPDEGDVVVIQSAFDGNDVAQRIQSRKINIDETINSVVVGLLFVGFTFWLYHTDACIPHPDDSNFQDIVTRVPIVAWEAYRTSLLDAPIATKACSSASVYAIGDVISQRTEGATFGKINRSRTLRSLVAGLVGHGPLSHYWYIYLDNFFDNVLHMTAWWSFLPKVLLDQTTVGSSMTGDEWNLNVLYSHHTDRLFRSSFPYSYW